MRSRASLRTVSDFRLVSREGRRAGADGLTVFVRAREQSETTRLGVAVGAKTTAVRRNKLRRQLRAALHAYSPSPGFDVLIRSDSSLDRLSYQELERMLAAALAAAGLPRVQA